MSIRYHGGPVFTAPFTAATVSTNAHDLWCLTASSSSRVILREVRIGQYSDFGDAQAELLSVSIVTGSSDPSEGSAITPRNVMSHAGAPTADSVVAGPSTGLASASGTVERWADTFNVAAGLLYAPAPDEQITINPGQNLVVRITAPNDELTMSGTLTFQEIGKVPA